MEREVFQTVKSLFIFYSFTIAPKSVTNEKDTFFNTVCRF